jgi:hypothetical protein
MDTYFMISQAAQFNLPRRKYSGQLAFAIEDKPPSSPGVFGR